MSEMAAVGIFALLVLTVFIAFVAELALALYRRWWPTPTPPTRRRRRVRAVILVVGLLGTACVAYGWLIEPTWLEVTHARLPLASLRKGTAPIRIVQVTDLHVDARPGNEERVPELVAAERPDLIVFTGDSINVPAGRDRFLACMERLAAIAPLYAVEGNWDVYALGGPSPLRASSAHVLAGEIVEVTVRGTCLLLAGVAYGEDATVPKLLGGRARDLPLVVLTHAPDPILEVADAGADVHLAGHTHGGQVRLPLYGALVTFARHGKRFDMGLYRVKDTWLYVSRGIGMEGGAAPRVRFLARPEVTVLDLVPKD
jgi:uncharacterized protein